MNCRVSRLLLVLALVVLAIGGTHAAGSRSPRMTYRSVGRPLSAVLPEVSRLTGVRMSVSSDAADLKIAVFARDLPVSDFRRSLCKVLRLECSQRGSRTRPSYLFRRCSWTHDRILNLQEQGASQLRVYVAALSRQMASAPTRDADLLTLANAGSVPDAARYRQSSPQLSLIAPLHGPSILTALRLYMALTPQQVRSLWKGNTVTIRPEILPEQDRAELLRFAAAWTSSMQSLEAAGAPTPDMDRAADCFSMRLTNGSFTNTPALACTVLLAGGGEYGDASGYTSCMDPVQDQLAIVWYKRATASPDAMRPGKQIAMDGTRSLYDLAARVSEAFGVSIVSDYSTRMTDLPNLGDLSGGYTSPLEALQALGASVRYEAGTVGSACTLENLNWFRDRSLEIPSAMVEQFRSARDMHDGLTLKDAMELASQLQPGSLETLRLYGLGNGYLLAQCRPAILLMRSLSGKQWTAAKSQDGLPVSSLYPSQLRMVEGWVGQPDWSTLGCRTNAALGFDTAAKVLGASLHIRGNTPDRASNDTQASMLLTLDSSDGVRLDSGTPGSHPHQLACSLDMQDINAGSAGR